MNQGSNQFNQNNGNIPNSNGIPTNQPLNQQPQMPMNNQNFNGSSWQPTPTMNTNVPPQNPMVGTPPSNGYPSQMNSVGMNTTPNTPEKKKNIVKYVLIVLAVIIVIGGIILGIKFLTKKKDSKNELSPTEQRMNSTAFFISNKDSKCALFDVDGNKLTDFIYDCQYSDFFNGVARVEKDDQYALIDEKGKEVVKFGEYEYISYRDSGLYEARGTDDKYYVINSEGKKVYSYNNNAILSSKRDLKDFDDSELYSYAVDGDKLIFFDVDGKILKEYTVKEEENSKGLLSEYLDDYLGVADDLYTSIYYDGNLTIFDNSNFKVVYDGQVDHPYLLKGAYYDNQTLLLEPLTYYGSSSGANKNDAIVYNKKFTELNFEYIKTENEILMGKYDNSYYVINPDGSKGIKEDSDTYFLNEKNYAISSGNHIDFYNNGKKIKTENDVYINSSGNVKNGFYVVNIDSTKKTLYDEKGERILGESYYYLTTPNSNNQMIAQKSEKGPYSLLDKKGKEIAQFDNIRNLGNYYDFKSKYYVITKDEKIGIADTNGKIIIEPKYKEFKNYLDTKDGLIVLGVLNDGSAEICSSKKGVIVTNSYEGYLKIEKRYITSTNNGTKDYYTFSGKKFYSE